MGKEGCQPTKNKILEVLPLHGLDISFLYHEKREVAKNIDQRYLSYRYKQIGSFVQFRNS